MDDAISEFPRFGGTESFALRQPANAVHLPSLSELDTEKLLKELEELLSTPGQTKQARLILSLTTGPQSGFCNKL